MFELSGKTILITGAGGAIGSETARLCARMGAAVVVTDIEAPQKLADELLAAGSNATALALDVTDRSAVEAAVTGMERLDGLVANAGYCPFDDWMSEDWDDIFLKVMDVNVMGVFHVVRAAMPRMIEAKSGRIVVVTSVAGRIGGVRSSPHYVAAKGGLNAFVKWAARRAAPSGVLVNGIAPGPTKSAMTADQAYDPSGIPVGRMAGPQEMAGPIAFLLSPASSYICGNVIDVNGGIFMH